MRRAARWIRTLALGPMAALALAQSSQAPTPPLPFSDVPAGHWAAEAVRRLSERGLLLGDDRGRFAGGGTLTRYEAALLIYRLLQQLEASALTREDLEALLMAVQELQAELAGLGLRLENAYSREEAQALLERLAALEARQALDPQALEDLRVLAEAASLTASQALLQSSLALERLAALEGRLAGLEQTAQGARALEAERFAALRREVEGLKAELAGLRGGLEAERASAPEDRGLQALELEARLKGQQERLAALEARLEAEGKERQAQAALAEARLAALEERQPPRFSLEFALALRQGYGFALGFEGPEGEGERALGRLRLSTERDGDRMALALYSAGGGFDPATGAAPPGPPAGYTAAGLEFARGGLELFGLWAGAGEYAYAVGWRLGGPDDRLRLWGQAASVRVPDTLAAPRVEAGLEGGLRLFGLAWSRLELAARLGRE
ncbi:S-layer homology domain-containing protein, partial [Calidithermus roseus]|uniref:S-layer homology domain-containing protein n=1 Tax=Calidithermus roseus TaxID=1644118 RepID=UPI0015F9035C